jgi:hypothetical protein
MECGDLSPLYSAFRHLICSLHFSDPMFLTRITFLFYLLLSRAPGPHHSWRFSVDSNRTSNYSTTHRLPKRPKHHKRCDPFRKEPGRSPPAARPTGVQWSQVSRRTPSPVPSPQGEDTVVCVLSISHIHYAVTVDSQFDRALNRPNYTVRLSSRWRRSSLPLPGERAG